MSFSMELPVLVAFACRFAHPLLTMKPRDCVGISMFEVPFVCLHVKKENFVSHGQPSRRRGDNDQMHCVPVGRRQVQKAHTKQIAEPTGRRDALDRARGRLKQSKWCGSQGSNRNRWKHPPRRGRHRRRAEPWGQRSREEDDGWRDGGGGREDETKTRQNRHRIPPPAPRRPHLGTQSGDDGEDRGQNTDEQGEPEEPEERKEKETEIVNKPAAPQSNYKDNQQKKGKESRKQETRVLGFGNQSSPGIAVTGRRRTVFAGSVVVLHHSHSATLSMPAMGMRSFSGWRLPVVRTCSVVPVPSRRLSARLLYFGLEIRVEVFRLPRPELSLSYALTVRPAHRLELARAWKPLCPSAHNSGSLRCFGFRLCDG